MKDLIPSDQLESHFLRPTHWIDVRAPIEFKEGSVPDAINLPLLTDSERHEVGICYKEKGPESAVQLGQALVNGPVRESRTITWVDEWRLHPNSVIYCFRGGLRSRTAQAWARDHGATIPIVEGGYKTLRHKFLEWIHDYAKLINWIVVCGPTGSRKTQKILQSGRPHLDLEGLARHRGSAFGSLEISQPTQVDFENALAVRLLHLAQQRNPVLIEDESRMIGRCSLPALIFEAIQKSQRIMLHVSLEERCQNILQDYLVDSKLWRDKDPSRFDEFERAIVAISQKLGGARTQIALALLEKSKLDFQRSQSLDSNKHWIRYLLEEYYDPLYHRAQSRSVSHQMKETSIDSLLLSRQPHQ